MADTEGVRTDDVVMHDGKMNSLEAENEALKKKVKQANKFALAFGVMALVATAVIMGVVVQYSIENDKPDDDAPKTCGVPPKGAKVDRMMLGEPSKPGPVHDVTVKEMKEIRKFLEDTDILKLKPEKALFNDSHIYTIDLESPDKAEMLNYLDNGGPAPDRYARVVLFRGDLSTPIVEERLCGPLGNISECKMDRNASFAYRPTEGKEFDAIEVELAPYIHRELGHILRESYDASFDLENCEDDCFNWWEAVLSSNTYGIPDVRKLWLLLDYDVPYYVLFPVDIAFLCNVNGVDATKFTVEKVWYAGTFFESVQDLKKAYENGSVRATPRKYPTEKEAEFANIKLRGAPKPSQPRRPPQLVEPDGKRYTIKHRMVSYLDMWSFHFRISTTYGAILYDIKFLNERVIYELSLQELVVTYAGHNPQSRTQFYVDSSFLTGGKSKALVPGADCPTTASFLPVTSTSQDKEEPAVFSRSICIFEQNSGYPLKRHHSYSTDEGAFYGGLLDTSLVMRSIYTVDNHDYIVDFTFHQTGAIGVTVALSGYIFTSGWSPDESPYGHRLKEFMFGPIHHHLANFKVDFDIAGNMSNRYETIDIKEETVTLRGTDPPRNYSQLRFDYDLKKTESEAMYIYEFEKPKYHIFHNNAKQTKFGEKRSYRLINHAKTAFLNKENLGPYPSIPWARYQIAVTKRKEEEQRSGTYFSQYDVLNPVVDFQTFLDDNDTIVDEDIVAWVTIGTYHIPHSEDLPVTATAGKKESFYIIPYNYFPECPSGHSRDAVYIKRKNFDKPSEGLMFEHYGSGDLTKEKNKGACQYKPFDMTQKWRKYPDDIIESKHHKGVY